MHSTDAIIKAGETKSVIFDVWYDHDLGKIGDRYTPSNVADVPDDLTLQFGFELTPAAFITDGEQHGYIADLPTTLTNPEVYTDGKSYYKTKITVPVVNRTNEDRSVTLMHADQQEPNASGVSQLWIERGVFDNWTNNRVIKAGETTTVTFDVWYDQGYTAKQIANQGGQLQISKGLDVAFGLTATAL